MTSLPVPVVDVFAGPGGLGEGLAQAHRISSQSHLGPVYDIKLSVEKDRHACRTLLLRHFYREFLDQDSIPEEYFALLRSETDLESLFENYEREGEIARSRVLQRELGGSEGVHREVKERIHSRIHSSEAWVLVGGPPCQAYSVVGRARNKGNKDYDAAQDRRHFLYEEFLRIVADHWPPVFVLENVKGLLSATVNNQKIFAKMLRDLQAPGEAVESSGSSRNESYRVCSFVASNGDDVELNPDADLSGAIVRMENFGIPQARHRVLLLGIREDLAGVEPKPLTVHDQKVPVKDVLAGLPSVRSGLSRKDDLDLVWTESVASLKGAKWFGPEAFESDEVYAEMKDTLEEVVAPRDGRGAEFVQHQASVEYSDSWFLNHRLGGVPNHRARAHMVSDLHRYLFAACYAKVEGKSPTLRLFPEPLLPDHKSVEKALEERWHFSDRFRVQVAGEPATTVTSHLSKDGHYFIHPDPKQCRSFTVREAARVQTFPDDYFFMGPRTSQFVQVGNAVPPLLAAQIGNIVLDILKQAGLSV